MQKKFFFLNSNWRDIHSIELKNFSLTILDFLKKDSIISLDLFKKLNINLERNPYKTEEFLIFLYQNFSEDEIKIYISNHFNFLYLDSFKSLWGFLNNFENSNNNIKIDITSDILKFMQITKSIPIFLNRSKNELYVLIDSNIDYKIEKFYCLEFGIQKIVYILTKKQVILDFICKQYDNLLIQDLESKSKECRPTAKKT